MVHARNKRNVNWHSMVSNHLHALMFLSHSSSSKKWPLTVSNARTLFVWTHTIYQTSNSNLLKMFGQREANREREKWDYDMIRFVWNMGQHEWCRVELYNEKWFRMRRIIYNAIFYTQKREKHLWHIRFYMRASTWEKNQTKSNTHTRTRTQDTIWLCC